MKPAMKSATSPMAHTACILCGGARAGRLFHKAGWTFVRCATCGLIALNPLPTPVQLKAHHEESYAQGAYATFAAADAVRRAIARYRLGIVLPLAPAGPWLDVGCSTGAFLAELARAGVTGEGLELSTAAVARAREQNLTVQQGTAESFIPTRRYAAITAFDLVEHLPDPLAFVGHVGSWLLPDGVLVLTLPNANSLLARLMRRHWFYYAPPDHIYYFTPVTIRRLLAASGLRVMAVRPVSKPLTPDYAASALAHFNPRLGRVARACVALGPRGYRSRPWPFRVGEMLVIARPAVERDSPQAGAT